MFSLAVGGEFGQNVKLEGLCVAESGLPTVAYNVDSFVIALLR